MESITAVNEAQGLRVVVVYEAGEVRFVNGETRIVYKDDIGRWFVYDGVVYRF